MNEDLLNTPIVKSAINHYLEIGYTIKQINERLMDVHLIIISNEELKNFIEKMKKGVNNA